MVEKYKYSRSKKFAWTILGIGSLLTGISLSLRMEGAAVAIWSTAVTSAVAMYANKQYQERKKIEVNGSN